MAATYTIQQLCDLVGVSDRTIRHWIDLGLLPRVEFRGPATRYGEEHVARMRAIRRLRKGERLSFARIKQRLAKMTAADIAALAAEPAQAAPASPADEPVALPRVERWGRVALLPGLDLVVRDDAPPLVQRIAAEIVQRYSAP